MTWFSRRGWAVAAIMVSLILVAAAAVGTTTHTPPAEVSIRKIATAQLSDSLRYAISWSAPTVDAQREPVGQYRLHVINRITLDTIISFTQNTEDTVALAWPAPGDTLQLRAEVAAIDITGLLGGFTDPVDWIFAMQHLAPLPPGGLQVSPLDTLLGLIPVDSTYVRPMLVYLAEGEQQQVCAILKLTDQTLELWDGHADMLYCSDRFTEFQAERSA